MIGQTVQAIMATLQQGFSKVLGVLLNDDGGEQVQPGHAEVLALGCSITDFPLAANVQRILEGVMCFALVQADLGATLHIGVQQPVDNEQRPFDPSDLTKRDGQLMLPEICKEFSQELAWGHCARNHGGRVVQDIWPI